MLTLNNECEFVKVRLKYNELLFRSMRTQMNDLISEFSGLIFSNLHNVMISRLVFLDNTINNFLLLYLCNLQLRCMILFPS